VISSGLRLAVAPLGLLVVAAIARSLPQRFERVARAFAVLACGAALAMLISDITVVAAQGNVEAAFGTPLSGTDFLFRADSAGVALAMIAVIAALVALLDAHRNAGRSGAILLCAAGTWGAALGGNVVMLFAGLEAANLGSFLLMSRGDRLSRGAVATFVIQHLASLGLLAGGIELAVNTGTTDLAAVPAGAVTAAVGIPWALAGAVQLISPALAPSGAGRPWAAIAAVPCGAAVLLRLRNLAGPLPTSVVVVMAVAGALIAVWGAVVAGRSVRAPGPSGRGLLLIGAGLPVAVVGMSADAAGSAAAAALGALELSVGAAALWTMPSWSRSQRGLTAFAMLVAGNLPVGLGLSAAVLTLGAAASLGLAGAALLVALGMSVTAGAVVSLRSALTLLQRPVDESVHPLPPLAMLALLLSAVVAVLPGIAVVPVLSALAPQTAIAADAAALRGPQGGWSGGYFALAAAWLTIVVVSSMTLIGRTAPANLEQAAPPAARPPWVAMLRLRRYAGGAVVLGLDRARALDRWLVSQPRLPMVLIATALAVFFLH
jgi:hypothetical protein